MKTLQEKLEDIVCFDPESKIVAEAVLCEFSSEDNTPTIHISLWKGFDLSDIPCESLDVVAEGFDHIGRTYSLQLANN
jgi:hypothetical protein